LYWIAAIVTGCFLIFFFLSRKEDTPSDTSPLLKPFSRIALYLVNKVRLRFPVLFSSVQVEKDLAQLHPGENREYLRTEYYVRKIAVCLAVIFLGTLFGAAVRFSAQGKVILREGGKIFRGGWQEGIRDIKIAADFRKQKMEFQIQVQPQRLTEEETEAMFDEFLRKLPEYILGGNESLQAVTEALILTEEYEGYPFLARWESNRPDILSSTGHVYAVDKEQQAELTLHLDYGGYRRMEEIKVILKPPVLTAEEQLYLEMEELLMQSQNSSLDQEEWQLPSMWRGEELGWRQLVEDNSLLLWTGAIGAAMLVYWFSDRDLHEQIEKRRRVLHREYPELVHKLVLFVGAGMTIKGAFWKIAGDYEAKRQAGGRESPAYEEMLYTCREQQAGISEGTSYEHLGRRTGLQEYIRLSTLLTQNLKRGSCTLLERLREEADKAAEEQLQQSRKLGEEAGTKLLVPMVMMLAVVMIVIMIPAFSSI